MRRLTIGVSVVLASVPLAFGQTAQPPVFRSGTDVLAVDVTVVDSTGRPITDLGKAEFTVTVDGEPRQVLTAEYISFESDGRSNATPAHFSTNAGLGAGRLIVIVIDQNHIQMGGGRAVVAGLDRLLDRMIPSDRVALVTIPNMGPNVDFTTDHDLVRQALGKVTGRALPLGDRFNLGDVEILELETGFDTPTREEVLGRECGSLLDQRSRARCEVQLLIEAERLIQEIRYRAEQTLRSLRTLIAVLGAIDGPKTLVFVSEGLISRGREPELAELGRLAAAARIAMNVVALDGPELDMSKRFASPTLIQDRQVRLEGLDTIAGMARGAVFRDVGGGGTAFGRIALEMSGYYLLGVEPLEADRDGDAHRIDVKVGRQGATVRFRREMRYPQPGRRQLTVDELLTETLSSPVSAIDVPMRVASYAYQDSVSPQVRVVIAADATVLPGESSELTMGFVMTDSNGQILSSRVENRSVGTVEANAPVVVDYETVLLLEPGIYRFKLAAVDANGRRGSVEHEVVAWKMAGEEFAVGDLMLADAPASQAELHPGVVIEPASGRLAAYTEVYATDAAKLRGAGVTIEIAEEEDGPALSSSPAAVRLADSGSRASAQVVIPVDELPSGTYLARAIVTDAGEVVGKLVRPFTIPAGGFASRARAVSDEAVVRMEKLAAPVDPLRPEQVLEPAVLSFFVDALAQAHPAIQSSMKATLAGARRGRLQGAGLQALDTGDQLAAAFLGGLELLAAGKLQEAATQFQTAGRIESTFAPAAFYLGACLAVSGRDPEAAKLWRSVALDASAPADLHGIVADLWLRLGDGNTAAAGLAEAVAQWPDNDALHLRLGLAYGLAGRHQEALLILEPYLVRHPKDLEALFVAVRALYELHAAGAAIGSPKEDADRAIGYARAYAAADGPRRSLVDKWAEFIEARAAATR